MIFFDLYCIDFYWYKPRMSTKCEINSFLFSRDTIKKFGGLVITLANKSRESVSWLLCITGITLLL